MATHVALLRGVNVGGVKLAMADLREVVAGLGHTGVTTYIQSGNELFSTEREDAAGLAAEMEAAIASALTVRPKVIVLSREELAQVVRDNPYPEEPNPKAVHAVFAAAEPDPGTVGRVAEAERAVAERGSRDRARFVGRVLYLHTPDGFGRSELAVRLSRGNGAMSARGGGTARNWATVTKLLALCDREG